jgi:hypothetical protein
MRKKKNKAGVFRKESKHSHMRALIFFKMPALHGGKISNYALQQHCKNWHKVFADVDTITMGLILRG